MARKERTRAVSDATRTNLLALDQPALERFVKDLGWPKFRAQQILRWLYQERVHDIERMTDLSKAERARLSTLAVIDRIADCEVRRSSDGTRKIGRAHV